MTHPVLRTLPQVYFLTDCQEKYYALDNAAATFENNRVKQKFYLG
jgi:hypothetical protein